MKAKLLVAILSLAMIFTFIPAAAFAETDLPDKESVRGEEPVIAAPADGWEYHSGGWKYLQDDGSYASGWFLDDDYYYYFDPGTGYAVTGWKKIGGYWYYFAPADGFDSGTGYSFGEGEMIDCGPAKINGKWYYLGPWPGYGTGGTAAKWGKLQYKWIKETSSSNDYWYYGDPNKDGQLAAGWKKIDGKWYYFETAALNYYDVYGLMYAGGSYEINKAWYYFAGNGALRSGWIKESGTDVDEEDGSSYYWEYWYYADPNNDCRLAGGWKKIDGKWYYFDKDWSYEMIANCTYKISGKLYAFNRNGSLHETAGWVNLYEEWFDKNGKKQTESYWVYTDKNGIAATGWKKISGDWYHFASDGYMTQNGWAKDSVGWMYMGSNGKVTKSKWVKDGGYWYYLKANGYMATGTQTIGGKTYKFDSSGRWIE